jgi:hypothetical protein
MRNALIDSSKQLEYTFDEQEKKYQIKRGREKGFKEVPTSAELVAGRPGSRSEIRVTSLCQQDIEFGDKVAEMKSALTRTKAEQEFLELQSEIWAMYTERTKAITVIWQKNSKRLTSRIDRIENEGKKLRAKHCAEVADLTQRNVSVSAEKIEAEARVEELLKEQAAHTKNDSAQYIQLKNQHHSRGRSAQENNCGPRSRQAYSHFQVRKGRKRAIRFQGQWDLKTAESIQIQS